MKKTNDLTLCALFIVFYIFASKVTIPIGIIPVTLQTCAVILAGCLLNRKQIAISFSVYIMMGLLGLPVFATGGGFQYILQPSFGFILAFPFAAMIICFCKQHFHLKSVYHLFPVCILALLFIYFIGTSYMYIILNFYMGKAVNIAGAIAIGVSPFIISDFISCSIGCIAALRLSKIKVLQTVSNT